MAKIIDTVEDADYKTTWYDCGCNKMYDKDDKTTDWQIDENINPSGKCKSHKKAMV